MRKEILENGSIAHKILFKKNAKKIMNWLMTLQALKISKFQSVISVEMKTDKKIPSSAAKTYLNQVFLLIFRSSPDRSVNREDGHRLMDTHNALYNEKNGIYLWHFGVNCRSVSEPV